MATDNVVRVVFEAYTDQFKRQVKSIIGSVVGLGDAGEVAEKELSFKDAQKGATSLTGKIKDAVSGVGDLGEKGQQSGRKMKLGFLDAESGAERLRKTINNITKFLAAGYIAGKIKDLGISFGNVVKEGLEYNAQIESFQTSFATMLGDEIKAMELVSSLKKEAAATPFGMKDLAESAQTLMSFGISLEETRNRMKELGDISLGNGERFKSLTLAFAQMASTGKLTGQDLMQMVNAGFNPLEEISRKTGKSIGELRDEMAKGAISAEMVSQAFTSATSEGGRFFRAMGAQSKTYTGQMATLQDGIESFKGRLAEGLSGLLSGTVLPKLNSWIEQLTAAFDRAGAAGGAFSGIGERISAAIGKLFNAVDSFIANGGLDVMMVKIGQIAVSFVELFLKMLEKAPSAFSMVGELISWLSDNLEKLAEIIKMGIQIWIAYKAVMLAIAIASNPIAAVIGLIISALVSLYLTSEKARRIIQSVFESIKLGVLVLARLWIEQFRAMAKVVEFLIGWIPGIGDAVKEVSRQIDGLAVGIDKMVASSTQKLNNLVYNTKKAANEAGNLTITVQKLQNGAPVTVTDEVKAKMLTDPDVVGEETAAKYKAIYESAKDTGNNTSFDADSFFIEPNLSTYTGSEGGLSGLEAAGVGTSVTDTRTAFEKGVENVNNSFKTREELIDSKIGLYDATGDNNAKKEAQWSLIDVLKEKLLAYTGLDKLVAGTDERNILEAAKNKILTEIAKVTNNIKGDLSQLVGSFNTPSEFTALTEYAYNTSTTNNSSLTRIISTPTLNMTLNVKDLGDASASEVRNKVNSFAESFIGKDSIVSAGWGDVLRN